MDFQMFIVQNAVLVEFYKKLLILKYLAEFKIAIGHRPFSDQNWLFPTICKSIRSFF